MKGGQAYERNKSARGGTRWRELYEEYKRNGLVKFYREQSLSEHQLQRGLRRGELISDRRLADYLDHLYALKSV